MANSITHNGRPHRGLPSLFTRWSAFVAGLFLIGAFIFGIAPQFKRLDSVGPLINYVEESGMDATGLFYTEVEETGDAENYLRNAAMYSPAMHGEEEN